MSTLYHFSVAAVLSAVLVVVQSQQVHLYSKPRALVSLLVDSWSAENYVKGAVVLAKSALRHAPGYFASMEMLVLKGRKYSPEVLKCIEQSGWKLKWVDPIQPPHPTEINLYKDQFAKLHIWAMDEYLEVVYMDLDVAFVGQLQGTFTTTEAYSTGCRLWAARDIRDGVWQNAFNMGVAAIRPNITEYSRLLDLLKEDHIKYVHWQSEQGFLAAVYAAETGWCVLPFEKNANIAAYAQLPEYWKAASENIQVLHHTLSKPMWHNGCKPDSKYAPLCDEWQAELSSSTRPVTVVTAYYVAAFGTTNSINAFRIWRRLLLDKDVPVVVFTDDRGSVPLVDTMNPDLTRVIEVGTDKFMASAEYFNWDKNLQLLQTVGHSANNIDAHKVALEKPMFVVRAIQQNHFHSSHYVWIDFVGLRSDRWGSDWTFHAGRFPSGNRLLLLNSPEAASNNAVDTTIMGGSVPAWQKWATLYRQVVESNARDNQQFFAADAVIASSVAKQHPDSACRLKPADTGDYWKWFLQYYLASTTATQGCAA